MAAFAGLGGSRALRCLILALGCGSLRPSAPPSSEVPEPAEPGSCAPARQDRQQERPEVSAAGDSLRPLPRGVGAGHPGSDLCAGPASAQRGKVGARRGRTAAVAGAEGSPAGPSRRFPGQPQSGPRDGVAGVSGVAAPRGWVRVEGSAARLAPGSGKVRPERTAF